MLISFGVQNYRSFGERQEFTFLASQDATDAGRLIVHEPLRASRVSALFGANASGKSNLIHAMNAARLFVVISATRMNQGDEIPEMVPNRLVQSLSGEPCRFDVSLLLGEERYEYGFACDSENVVEEWLSTKPLKSRRSSRVFTRARGLNEPEEKWEWGSIGARDKKLIETHTRANGLALSRAAELNIDPFSAVYRWFKDRLRIIDNADPTGFSMEMMGRRTAEMAQQNEAMRGRLRDFLRAADVGVSDVEIEEKPLPLPKSMPRELRRFFGRVERESGNPVMEWAVSTLHRTDAGKRVVFDLKKDESAGTRRWFDLLGFLFLALDDGCLVVIDELDCSLHPLLTEKVVGLFSNPRMNPSGAQLLFSSHDVTLLRPELLRRDQVWLVEKNAKQQSELFSLYDLTGDKKPRSKENWSREYLRGVYGAVPMLGEPLESVIES